MLGWAFFKDLVKSVINQRLIETEQNVPCFPPSFAIFFLCHCQGESRGGVLKRSAPKASYYFLLWSCLIFRKWVNRLSLVQAEPFLWAPLCKTKKHIASQAKQVCTIEDFLTTRLCQVCSQPCMESCYFSARSYRPKIITDVYLSQRILSTPKHQGKKIY